MCSFNLLKSHGNFSNGLIFFPAGKEELNACFYIESISNGLTKPFYIQLSKYHRYTIILYSLCYKTERKNIFQIYHSNWKYHNCSHFYKFTNCNKDFSESYSILVLYLQYYCKLHSRHVTSKTQNIDTWENNIGKYIDGYRYRQPEWKTRCNKYLLMLHYGVYSMFHETSSAFCRISKIKYNVILGICLWCYQASNSV